MRYRLRSRLSSSPPPSHRARTSYVLLMCCLCAIIRIEQGQSKTTSNEIMLIISTRNISTCTTLMASIITPPEIFSVGRVISALTSMAIHTRDCRCRMGFFTRCLVIIGRSYIVVTSCICITRKRRSVAHSTGQIAMHIILATFHLICYILMALLARHIISTRGTLN